MAININPLLQWMGGFTHKGTLNMSRGIQYGLQQYIHITDREHDSGRVDGNAGRRALSLLLIERVVVRC